MSRPYQLTEAATPMVTAHGIRMVGFVADGAGGWMIRAVDPTSDAVLWETPTPLRFQYPPTTARFACRGHLLFATEEDALACVNPESGRLLWATRIGREVERTSRRWLREGATDMVDLEVIDTAEGLRVFLRIDDGDDRVVILDAADGDEVARITADDHTRYIPGVGVAVINDGDTLAVHGGDGQIVWTDRGKSVVPAGDNLLVDTGDDVLKSVEARTGREVWSAETPELQGLDDAAAGSQAALLLANHMRGTAAWPIPLASGPKRPGFFAKMFGRARGINVKGEISEVASAAGDCFYTCGNDGDDWYVSVVQGGSGQVVDTQQLPGADWVHLRTGGGQAVARIDKEDSATLRAVGPDGGVVWERDLGEGLAEHFCVGSDVVAVLMRQVALLDGRTGESRWAYAF